MAKINNFQFEAIKRLMLERGFADWKAFAEASGVSENTLMNLSRGENIYLNGYNTRKVALTLGVSADQLLFDEDEAPVGSKANDELTLRFSQLDPEQRKAAESYLQFLQKSQEDK